MFNRVVLQEAATAHNIQDIMGKSRKRTPVCCWVCCKSQKRGKQFSNRRFRRCEHQRLSKYDIDSLPLRQRDLTEPWDLGGDGKGYHHPEPNEEWFKRMMRK